MKIFWNFIAGLSLILIGGCSGAMLAYRAGSAAMWAVGAATAVKTLSPDSGERTSEQNLAMQDRSNSGNDVRPPSSRVCTDAETQPRNAAIATLATVGIDTRKGMICARDIARAGLDCTVPDKRAALLPPEVMKIVRERCL